MRGLLERWAQLEPKRLDLQENPSGLPVIAFGGQKFYSIGGPVSNAVILAATIEAIDARKWTWGLQGPRKNRAGHTGIVYHPKREGPPWKVRSGDTPAEALLAAYLAALEAA